MADKKKCPNLQKHTGVAAEQYQINTQQATLTISSTVSNNSKVLQVGNPSKLNQKIGFSIGTGEVQVSKDDKADYPPEGHEIFNILNVEGNPPMKLYYKDVKAEEDHADIGQYYFFKDGKMICKFPNISSEIYAQGGINLSHSGGPFSQSCLFYILSGRELKIMKDKKDCIDNIQIAFPYLYEIEENEKEVIIPKSDNFLMVMDNLLLECNDYLVKIGTKPISVLVQISPDILPFLYILFAFSQIVEDITMDSRLPDSQIRDLDRFFYTSVKEEKMSSFIAKATHFVLSLYDMAPVNKKRSFFKENTMISQHTRVDLMLKLFGTEMKNTSYFSSVVLFRILCGKGFMFYKNGMTSLENNNQLPADISIFNVGNNMFQINDDIGRQKNVKELLKRHIDLLSEKLADMESSTDKDFEGIYNSVALVYAYSQIVTHLDMSGVKTKVLDEYLIRITETRMERKRLFDAAIEVCSINEG